ncbi:MAG: LysR family transcriptional regulator [Pararhizobium sp.]
MEPDLADIRHFAAVAEARSFRGAAKLRGVSASALSDAVRRLEAVVGVRLLNRTTRSVTLTEAGQRLLERAGPALDEITAAITATRDFASGPTGTLRLNVPTIVARSILPPIAAEFLAAHPNVRLEVIAQDTFVDVLAAGFDAGVRYEESLARDMIAVPIGPRRQRFVAAAAPAYLVKHGTPAHPDDLVQHQLIGHRFASGALGVWELERGDETVRVRPEGRLVASSLEIEVAAALAGLGIVYTFEETLAGSLASGALVPVLDGWWASFPGPLLYYPSRRHTPSALRAFLAFIRARQRVGEG